MLAAFSKLSRAILYSACVGVSAQRNIKMAVVVFSVIVTEW
jgi:hypothetical protein